MYQNKKVSPSGGDLEGATKHEIIPCDRCGARIECKANAYTKCQCSVVQLTLNEVQYISENYEGCMCAKCLLELQEEYREMMGITQ
ncbi:cysteine-rich CWC family protein [Mucilaginibacter antarcticus]|uniref:Cysteine-rich CWC family protein n=1 Tax=Mucilaginibacter antarcticus TaxID=1855725 RepID=A0ABW5XRW6_9SPHI